MREVDAVIARRLASGVPLVARSRYIISAGGKRLRRRCCC
jgi:octaprenyl-diphosphate synthase